MENEDLELLGDEDSEVEELKTIDRYFDQYLKDNPTNVKFIEYNLDQSVRGQNVPTIQLVNKFIKHFKRMQQK